MLADGIHPAEREGGKRDVGGRVRQPDKSLKNVFQGGLWEDLAAGRSSFRILTR